MRVSEAEFEKSAVRPPGFPEDPLPEVAFAGRSNVGKSSMMNTLLGRRGLVKTSGKPGKTQTLNFFRVRAGKTKFRFVDLPGYGYAKVPETMRRSWQRMIEDYLAGREQLRGVVVILDIRRGLMDMDRQLLEWLASKGIECLVVLTKADKLSANQRATASAQVRSELDLEKDQPIAFSALDGRGKDKVWQWLGPWLRNPGRAPRD